MKSHLTIETDGSHGSVNYDGDLTVLARVIIRLAKTDDEFALALNNGMITLRENIKAIEIRDKMIGMINNSKQ